MLQTTPINAPCPTCERAWSADDFYAGCTECKTCKRSRSRHNRAVNARKLALAERMVDALVALAEQGWQPDCTRRTETTTQNKSQGAA